MSNLLYLAITLDCNLRCIYCYAHGGESREYMSFATARKAIEKYYDDSLKVQFTGGEPLLNFKLITKLAERYGAKFSVQTNGTLLDIEKIEKLRELGVTVGVSIDGPAKVNDKLRPYADGRGSTKDVLRAMMLLKSLGVDYGITCVVTPHNERRLREAVDLAYAFGARSISFDVLKRAGRGKNMHLPDTSCIQDAMDYSMVSGYRLRFRNMIKNFLSGCAALNGRSVFVSPSGKEAFTCPTIALAGIEIVGKCPFRS